MSHLFSQARWLDAVGDWQTVRAGKASMPIFPGKRLGMRALTMPMLTPSVKIEASSTEEVEALIHALPGFSWFNMRFHYSFTNWFPFYWNGFKQTTRYTYMLEIGDTGNVWSGFKPNVRNKIRIAERAVAVGTEDDLERFYSVVEKTFDRQELPVPFGFDFFQRCVEAVGNDGLMLRAYDKKNRTHSVIFAVKDDGAAYYLIGASDPALRKSGTQSLLIWEAIKWAAEYVGTFDFEGSMIRPIEMYLRSFGGRLVPYYKITKGRGLLKWR